jgi:K+-sensing histidine kinase KdpD
MVIGEGLVFCILLFLGFRFIHKTIKTDMQLAKTENTFLLSVTHELKTPLASIRLMLDTLLKRKTDEETQRNMLNNAQIALNKLHQQIENILLATRTHGVGINLWNSTIELDSLADIAIKKYRQWYPDHFWILEKKGALNFPFDPELMNAILSNLMDNAAKYSAPGSTITIVLDQTAEITIRVKDEGIGFKEQERDQVLKAFYRGVQSRTQQPGTGLGLHLVQNIIKIYNGSISIRENEPKGSIIEIKLPYHGKEKQ